MGISHSPQMGVFAPGPMHTRPSSQHYKKIIAKLSSAPAGYIGYIITLNKLMSSIHTIIGSFSIQNIIGSSSVYPHNEVVVHFKINKCCLIFANVSQAAARSC